MINNTIYNEMADYIVRAHHDTTQLFDSSPYLKEPYYPIILGVFIYGNIDSYSNEISSLPDNSLSKLWCINYNPEYKHSTVYSEYEASKYAYQLSYLFSFETGLDLYMDEYTHRLRIVHFDSIYVINKTTKVVIMSNCPMLYEMDESSSNQKVLCNLNITEIYKQAIFNKHTPLLDYLSNPLNVPRRAGLFSTIESLFESSDNYRLKLMIINSYAYLKKTSYSETDVTIALILEQSFRRTIAMLDSIQNA